jgi:hypothetical protein
MHFFISQLMHVYQQEYIRDVLLVSCIFLSQTNTNARECIVLNQKLFVMCAYKLQNSRGHPYTIVSKHSHHCPGISMGEMVWLHETIPSSTIVYYTQSTYVCMVHGLEAILISCVLPFIHIHLRAGCLDAPVQYVTWQSIQRKWVTLYGFCYDY